MSQNSFSYETLSSGCQFCRSCLKALQCLEKCQLYLSFTSKNVSCKTYWLRLFIYFYFFSETVAGTSSPTITALRTQLTSLLCLVFWTFRSWKAGAGPFTLSCDGFARSARMKLQLALEIIKKQEYVLNQEKI